MTVLAILGTDTGCGKTVLTAALALALRRRGRAVAALKPVATGVSSGHAGEDAELLADATGHTARECSLATYGLPRSPLSAARAEGRDVDVEGLITAVRRRAATPGVDVLLVEGVGGVLVPLTPEHTVRDLVRRLDVPVLIAARAGLGTINHTALTVEACRNAGIEILGVVLVDVEAGTDAQLVTDNAAQIQAQCAVPILGTLCHLAHPGDLSELAEAAESIEVDALDARLVAVAGDGGVETRRLDRAHLWHPFTQTSEWMGEEALVVRSAHGCRLRTGDGRELVDGIGALWANVHGYGHPGIDAAIREQLGRVAHSTLLGQTHPGAARLAADLAALTPGLDRVFLSESGASAVEVALRIALLAQRHRGASHRTRFLSLADAYHGDTAGAVSVGRSQPFHRGLDALLVDVTRLRPPHHFRVQQGMDQAEAEHASLEELDGILVRCGGDLAGFVVEPRVQGAAGILLHSDAWLRAATERCRASGALIICDEVATGFGRTGDLFASFAAGVVPDVLCLGKGLSGGYLPISATVVSQPLFDLFTAPYAEHRTLYYGHTFTGNPLACAAAMASLRAFDAESTLERGRRLADQLATGLRVVRTLEGVAEVRQRGVMCGIELGRGGPGAGFPTHWRVGRQVTLAARRRGAVVRPLGDVVVINPAPVMSEADCQVLLEAVTEAIVETTQALTWPGSRVSWTPAPVRTERETTNQGERDGHAG